MGRITKELRHFESIFLVRQGHAWRARVFDLLGELDFAGHPVIGAACVLRVRQRRTSAPVPDSRQAQPR